MQQALEPLTLRVTLTLKSMTLAVLFSMLGSDADVAVRDSSCTVADAIDSSGLCRTSAITKQSLGSVQVLCHRRGRCAAQQARARAGLGEACQAWKEKGGKHLAV
jgi:hypothetical protein